MNDLTALVLFALAGSGLSLFFRYFPKVKVWFKNLDPTGVNRTKELIVLATCAITAILIILAGCNGYGGHYGIPNVSCDRAGVESVITAFVFIVLGTQGTYPLIKE